MEHGRIEGTTRTCGKSQGYLGLNIRDIRDTIEFGEPGNVMVTAWIPTPDELERLNAGGSIYVHIMGSIPAPMKVTA